MVKLMLNSDNGGNFPPAEKSKRQLPDVAIRALAEADARRKASQESQIRPKEIGGSKGPEPIRFGDWEIKGIASDF